MKDHSRPFEFLEMDRTAKLAKDTEFNLSFPYTFFNKLYSINPSLIVIINIL